MSRDTHDPLEALSASMDHVHLSSSESETIWADVRRRATTPANDLLLEPVDLPITAALARPLEGERRLRVPRWFGLVAAATMGVSGAYAAQAAQVWNVQRTSVGSENLAAMQGEILIEYFDVRDAMCDVSPTDLACGPVAANSDGAEHDRGATTSSSLAHDGRTAYRRGELREARVLLEGAIRLNPNDSGALNSLGRVAADQGASAEAEGLFRKALVADPCNAFAMVNLATLLNLRRDYTEAAVLVRRAADVDPGLAQAQGMMRRLAHLADEPSNRE